MVVSVGDDVLPNSVDGHAGQAVELPFAVAVLSELLHELSVRVEHLHAMVGRIRDNYGVVGTHGHAAGPRE